MNWLPIECGLSINISDKFSHTFETAPKWWLVALVVPILSKCEEFKCCDKGKHSVFLTTLSAKDFFSVLRTEGKIVRVRSEKVSIVSNKPQKKSTETSK